MTAQNIAPAIEYAFQTLDHAFPKVDANCVPLGGGVLVQIRRVMTRTATGFYLPDETIEAEKANTQVGKVIALGPLAFHHRESLAPWKEGGWVAVGDFVRISKFNGYRFTVKWKDPDWRPPPAKKRDLTRETKGDEEDKQPVEEIGFVIFEDHMLVAKIPGDPRQITSYL